MRTPLYLALLAAAAHAACVPPRAPAESPDVFASGFDEVNPWPDGAPDVVVVEESPARRASPEQRAARLQAKALLVDGHSAVPSLLLGGAFDRLSPGHEPTAAELDRIKAAGVAGAFFSIHVGAPSPQAPSPLVGSAARRALDLIDATHRQIERNRATLVLARSATDVRRAKREGKIAVLIGVEGGHAIENSLPALRSFYRLGVRSMTLTHTTTNDWADSAGGALEPAYARHRGLAPFGEAVVREMQRIGMLVDLSHASDSTFKAVMKVAKAPVITSSSMPAAGHRRRELDDYMLRAVAENRGIVMVNSWALFLDEAYAEQSERFVQKHGAQLKELGEKLQGDPRALREEIEKLRALEGPAAPLPLARVVDHIDRAVKIAGIDHVGVGSSFGGIEAPQDRLAGIDGLPNIALELVRRGYSDGDILSLLGGNFVRVLEQAEAYAAATETTLSGDGSERQLSAVELHEAPGPLTALPPPAPAPLPAPPAASRLRESWVAPPPAPPPPRAIPRPTKDGAPEPAPPELMMSR
ncbi:dipeptidase [Sorangium sp. So ce131]|uniref:dipeptidase n=1 Tax=Sorangium sp. So ce131 TaxID=3133282 RepID=UPI003F640785